MRRFGIPMAARTSIFGLILTSPVLAATKHQASSTPQPFVYDTTGVIDQRAATASITGPSVLQFQGVTGAVFTPGSGQTIQLGQFVVPTSNAPTGQTTTYDHTPFLVQIRAPELDRTSTVPLLDKVFPKFGHKLSLKTVTESSLLIRGTLDGTVSPTGQSNVTVTVNAIRPGGLDMQTQDHVTHYAFPVRFGDLRLPPSWTMTAMTPSTIHPVAAAQILDSSPTPTPEPSTIALFATAFGGLIVVRRRSSRNTRSA